MLIGHRAHARLVVGVSAAPAGLTAARPAWRAPGAFCGCTSKGRTLSLYPLEKRRVGPLPRRRKTASRLCSGCCLTLWRTAAPRAASSTSPRRVRSFRPSSAAGTTRPGRPPRTNYLTQAIRCMYRELARTLTPDGLAGVRQGVDHFAPYALLYSFVSILRPVCSFSGQTESIRSFIAFSCAPSLM